MKKILVRIVGSLCILAAVLMFLLPAWVTIKDVSRKDMREFRDVLITDWETTENLLINELSQSNSAIKEDLKDNDLPNTKSGIKKRIGVIEKIIKDIFVFDISLKKVMVLSFKTPRLITDTENFLNTSCCNRILDAVFLEKEEVESVVNEIVNYKGIFTFVGIFFIVLALLGIASAATHNLNKVRWLKYIFVALLLLVVIGVCIATPILNEIIQNELEIDEIFEDMSLHITVMPFLCVTLAIVPIILDVIFERNNKKEV